MKLETPASEISADERCQYPNKLCTQRRTTKRDGGLHRFCAAHRDRANRNQRRWLESRQHKLKTPRLSSARNELTATDQSSLPPSTLGLDQLEMDFEVLFGANVSALENVDLIFDESQDLSLLDDAAIMDFIDQFFPAEVDPTPPS